MGASLDVAVIGAGPYGLSIAAHLAGRGVDHLVFGHPMQMWRDHMPPGMHLKSDGKSSDLSDPQAALTLAAFCQKGGLPYHRALLPVPVETFSAYGLAFQQQFVPGVARKLLTRLERAGDRFNLHFDDGEWLIAKRVVLAVGVMAFRHVPEMFADLPPELAAHSSAYGPLDRLAGREVVIVGGGSSALDLAAVLLDQGSRVTVVARAGKPIFHGRPPTGERSLLWRLRAPDSKIGAGWKLRICDDAPQLFRLLPDATRKRIVETTLGPSGGYFIRDQVEAGATLAFGRGITAVGVQGDRVRLQTRDRAGRQETIEGDQVVLATGYRLDMDRLGFLTPEVRQGLATADGMPLLSANFETSVPGLYMAGFAAMRSFGPVMRFVAGAPHPARRLAGHLASALRRPGLAPAPLKAAG